MNKNIPMKMPIKLVSTVYIVSAMIAPTAGASTIVVDENGNGSYNGTTITSGFYNDPINGGNPGFAYVLPFVYTWSTPAADIQVSEPGSTVGSDMLRFMRDASGLNTLLFFYSDASVPGDPPDASADVLTMPSPVYLYLSGAETGLFANPYSETGPNGFVYVANPGMPGEDGSGQPTQYTFISDIPEPSSLALLAGGLGMLCGLRPRRR